MALGLAFLRYTLYAPRIARPRENTCRACGRACTRWCVTNGPTSTLPAQAAGLQGADISAGPCATRLPSRPGLRATGDEHAGYGTAHGGIGGRCQERALLPRRRRCLAAVYRTGTHPARARPMRTSTRVDTLRRELAATSWAPPSAGELEADHFCWPAEWARKRLTRPLGEPGHLSVKGLRHNDLR